ncbi:hypothetical protein INT45_000768 [Circinella minor]|uniref:RNA-dependent RNA polymerase n=1 Tax=Circinella minor TaxID=1195481 RepID=A0A8H7VCM8_9FUNG|nr:hypothetical protein INT45_000768 [Circinella minor]
MENFTVLRSYNHAIMNMDDTYLLSDDLLNLQLGSMLSFRSNNQHQTSTIYAASFSMGYMKTPNTFVRQWETCNNVRFHYNYVTRLITIFFNNPSTTTPLPSARFGRYRVGVDGSSTYKVEFHLKSLLDNEIIVEQPDASGNSVTFTMMLQCAGKFWKEFSRTTGAGGKSSSTWERLAESYESSATTTLTNGTSDNYVTQEQGQYRNRSHLGDWTTFQVTFQLDELSHGRARRCYKTFMRRIADQKVVPRGSINPGIKIYVIEPSSLTTAPTPLNQNQRFKRIPDFEAFYTLECFISNHRLHPDNLTDEFYTTLCRLPTLDAIEALKVICFKEDKRVWDPAQALEEWVQTQNYFGGGNRNKHHHSRLHRRRKSSRIVRVYKALVTPTTIQFELPQPEMSNRVIREYKEYADRFLRVQFVEEGLGPLINTGSTRFLISDRLFDRILEVITQGIHIGDRHYEFLAFSSSQLRTHGCWFFCATDDLNCDTIRNWMGTFDNEKVVAKYAARMGQCFSSTHAITKLEPSQIIEKEEVEVENGYERKKYTFSDGVGTIAPDLAEFVATKMNRQRVPSAFQIRLGGAKGVLTVHHDTEPGIIALRPSQIKFKSESLMLEIANTAKFSCAHLNRQLITILSSLGVPDSSFLEIQQELITSVEKMLTDSSEASRVLRETSDGLGIYVSMAKMIEAGLLTRQDPYIKNLLAALRVNRLKEARERARIPVVKGAFLIGVLDETNTLEPDQVFCQFIDGNLDKRVVEGDCLVYRSPSLHPGDVRMLNAVTCPELEHLYNVVVFPAKGERDIPSMCSGGDLDGDCYRLFPQERNITPMDYTAPTPFEVNHVSTAHIQHFFVEFIKSSNLGQIANAHLARADVSPHGVFDWRCIELAELHSEAVDFAKTGKAAKPDPDLLTMPSKKYPDFMEKKDKESYRSEKALGQLYRSIGHIKYREFREKLWDITDGNYYDQRVQAPGMEKYIASARRQKRYYDRELRDLMGRFGVDSEAEIMSGCIIKWLHKKRNERLFEVQYQARKDVVRMKKRWYHEEFKRYFKDNIGPDTTKDLEAKAAAFYYVTYHPKEQRRALDEGRRFDNRYDGELLMSFPWMAQDILCGMVKQQQPSIVENAVYGENNYPTFDEEMITLYDTDVTSYEEKENNYYDTESDYGSEYEIY